jgi:hypothetical protein
VLDSLSDVAQGEVAKAAASAKPVGRRGVATRRGKQSSADADAEAEAAAVAEKLKFVKEVVQWIDDVDQVHVEQEVLGVWEEQQAQARARFVPPSPKYLPAPAAPAPAAAAVAAVSVVDASTNTEAENKSVSAPISSSSSSALPVRSPNTRSSGAVAGSAAVVPTEVVTTSARKRKASASSGSSAVGSTSNSCSIAELDLTSSKRVMLSSSNSSSSSSFNNKENFTPFKQKESAQQQQAGVSQSLRKPTGVEESASKLEMVRKPDFLKSVLSANAALVGADSNSISSTALSAAKKPNSFHGTLGAIPKFSLPSAVSISGNHNNSSSSSSSSNVAPQRALPINIQQQITDQAIRRTSLQNVSTSDRASKWMKPIDDGGKDKNDMKSALEKRIGEMRYVPDYFVLLLYNPLQKFLLFFWTVCCCIIIGVLWT